MPPLMYRWNVFSNVFWIVYVVWFVLGIRGALAQPVKADAKKQDRGSIVVLFVGLYAGLLLNFVFARLFPSATITWHLPILVLVGLVLMVLGSILRQYAIRVLGQYFTREVATRADQQMVQRGPYRRIRHPAYSGTLLTVLGGRS
jgi:protein-S-isoprenylcysteine O-methyltransferase Ste14